MRAGPSDARRSQRFILHARRPRPCRPGLGRCANPAVGCVLVREGSIVGRGWTQKGGRPHAETEALARAGERARGATAYVSLEPCAHRGATGPCSEALIKAGIARAVIALEDPDPRVNGQGIARLHAAGAVVTTGLCRKLAEELNLGFLLRVTLGRPLFTLKLATSLDGRIATRSGDSKWITGEQARARAHLLRATHDAVLVGSGTVLADDPDLRCRLPGLADRSPVRLVADTRLRTPADARLVRTAGETPTWILTTPHADPAKRALLADAGVETIDVGTDNQGRLDPVAMAGALAARGLTRVMLEGGGTLAAAFLRANLIDRLAWFTAPKRRRDGGRRLTGAGVGQRRTDIPAQQGGANGE
ncbi:MAG: bifunctional diaminohydroxyphosphoribosylaminopyrimidine deaminase/5-amino-6-(5-phosphoribosylamino)uracil reductase RibD [Rhodospirillales bacterium]|nr:bifunctional diaminohydroxyphosphoribosylaminopyrimidine deaminase/5-amino-6-(5-phosphoribosylamino)uracil reductase RibD [Rhodospirillales bacterium]